MATNVMTEPSTSETLSIIDEKTANEPEAIVANSFKPLNKKAKEILWQISIKPTLEAYCGTMDSNAKDVFINKCKNAFGVNTNQKE